MRRADLEQFVGATVDDLIGPGLKLLFVGINPGLWTAATGAHFAHPGNRFYPALAEAGITDYRIDAADGYSDADRDHLIERGIGVTNFVERATATAAELERDEYREGAERLVKNIEAWQPPVVAVVGIGAYRTAFKLPKAKAGRQDVDLGGAKLWVLGNPSGLNAHETVGSLAKAYREPAEAAGIV